jgi:hypothetical protein
MARAETRLWPPPRGRDIHARVCLAACVDAEGVARYALARVVGRCDRRDAPETTDHQVAAGEAVVLLSGQPGSQRIAIAGLGDGHRFGGASVT